MQSEIHAPVFIGGTGRSGTSVMGDFLSTHPDIVLPVRENKLIIENHGLRMLIDQLSDGFDYKSNHYAVARFLEFAALSRISGFQDHRVQLVWRAANKITRTLFRKTLSPFMISRMLGANPYGAHPIGDRFGLDHYDACIEAFSAKLIADVDKEGVFVAEGFVRPVYMASTFERETLLIWAREFLSNLNSKALAESGARTWCDDTPSNAHFADFLLELYPEAKIVHMVRDPRDVLASFLEQPWVSPDISRTVLRLCNAYRRLIEVEGRLGSTRFLTLRLEDMCGNFEATKARLCDHCGISSEGFDGSVHFRQSRIGTWQRKISAEQHARITKDLAFALDHFGYGSST